MHLHVRSCKLVHASVQLLYYTTVLFHGTVLEDLKCVIFCLLDFYVLFV